MPYADGTLVRIKSGSGMKEFRGKTGEVVGRERDGQTVLHRVRLHVPVYVASISATVTDDLWSSEWLEEIEEHECDGYDDGEPEDDEGE